MGGIGLGCLFSLHAICLHAKMLHNMPAYVRVTDSDKDYTVYKYME
jgi:hypothetical protein